jgi:hypothetical protein
MSIQEVSWELVFWFIELICALRSWSIEMENVSELLIFVSKFRILFMMG